MAPHSSTLAWKIPWTEQPGGLQSKGSLRVRHDWATSLWLFTFMHWRRKWQPTPVFLPGESQGRGAWWAAVYGVAQSQTRMKRLSSSSSRLHQLYFHKNSFHVNINVWQRFIGERNASPFQDSFLENPMDRRAWQSTAHRVTESDMPKVISKATQRYSYQGKW